MAYDRWEQDGGSEGGDEAYDEAEQNLKGAGKPRRMRGRKPDDAPRDDEPQKPSSARPRATRKEL